MTSSSRSGRFLFLVNTPNPRPGWMSGLKRHRFDVVQQHELDRIDLDPFAALVLTIHSDQIHLAENAAKLDTYLDGGGAIVFNGHAITPFLPEVTTFEPVVVNGRESVRIHREADHALFRGVSSDDLSYQRGVMGFYGRGFNPPPPGAEIMNTIGPERRPVDWLVTRPSGGRLFVHAGNDLFSFLDRAGGGDGQALQNFFDWFVETDHAAPRRN